MAGQPHAQVRRLPGLGDRVPLEMRSKRGQLRGNQLHRDPPRSNGRNRPEICSKARIFQLDRDRPRSQRPPFNPKVTGSNPVRPIASNRAESAFYSRKSAFSGTRPRCPTSNRSNPFVTFTPRSRRGPGIYRNARCLPAVGAPASERTEERSLPTRTTSGHVRCALPEMCRNS